MIFSKGPSRKLRLDTKKNLLEAKVNNIDYKNKSSYEIKELLEKENLTVHYMRGTSKMLPVVFDYQPKNVKDRIVKAEKPIGLLEEIIDNISKPLETLVDQYGGSGSFGIACHNKKRNSIIIEKDKNTFQDMKKNVEQNLNVKFKKLEENSYIDI